MKILMILTNNSTYGNDSEKTGLWIGEATEFIANANKELFDFDYASPNGGNVPLDPRSLEFADEMSKKMLKEDSDFINGITNSKKISEVNINEYDAIYFTGGHGVMWDFFENQEIALMVNKIIDNNGYVISVCHGVAGILNVKNSQGEYVIKDKKITGFTSEEEVLSGKDQKVPFYNEEIAKMNGADFIVEKAFKSNVVVDGQFITGQNPYSVVELAKVTNDVMNSKKF